MTDAAQDSHPWISKWLAAVHTGSATMSQRARSTIDRHGGPEAVIAAARERGLHLVELTDDKGTLLVAASVHPFTTFC